MCPPKRCGVSSACPPRMTPNMATRRSCYVWPLLKTGVSKCHSLRQQSETGGWEELHRRPQEQGLAMKRWPLLQDNVGGTPSLPHPLAHCLHSAPQHPGSGVRANGVYSPQGMNAEALSRDGQRSRAFPSPGSPSSSQKVPCANLQGSSHSSAFLTRSLWTPGRAALDLSVGR